MLRRLLCIAIFTVGCDAPPAERAADEDGVTAGGGGAEPAPEPAFYASFVPEKGPGAGPALLRLVNDTDGQILSITLPTGEAFAFYLIEPGMSSDYAPIASTDLLEDAILSLHTLDTCIRKPFAEMNGPRSLEPGHAYSLHVGLQAGFIADVIEEPTPEPFVGVRVLITDFTQVTQVGAASRFTLSLPDGEREFEDIFDELPAPFEKLDVAALAPTGLRLTDKSGVVHAADAPSLPGGVFGYTVHVAPEPVEGAVVVPLAPP